MQNLIDYSEKRYYSLDYYLKKIYGEKLYKISLNGGMTCPNRDGTVGNGAAFSVVQVDPGTLLLPLQKVLPSRLPMERT